MLRIDALVAEIGSTTTVVNAFDRLKSNNPLYLGQGVAPTSVTEGDVTRGLLAAIEDLKVRIGESLTWREFFATSSAAGGLRMTVHGLVHDMTVKAGNEAALGAGAIVRMVTSGVLTGFDLKKLGEIKPNIILLAGGVDYGEYKTTFQNATLLSDYLQSAQYSSTVIYAGNKAIAGEVAELFARAKVECFVAENVYPNIDDLNVGPTRKVIQKVFESNICEAPGMSKIRKMVKGNILPTPGAVMEAAKIIYQELGDLMVLDVGGATTDVHSITEAPLRAELMAAGVEPKEKRTVEGDLGVYINASNLVRLAGADKIEELYGKEYQSLIKPIPTTTKEVDFIKKLLKIAVQTAVSRHVGSIKPLYGQNGRMSLLVGKDLSYIKWIVGTGGALTRIEGGQELLSQLRRQPNSRELLPGPEAVTLIDKYYIMAAVGVLSLQYPRAAFFLLAKSFEIDIPEVIS